MRVAILNGDSPRFLKAFYGRAPALAEASYRAQIAARADSLVGVCDSYSRNFRRLGHDAQEFYVNNPWMRTAWAREHGIKTDPAPEGGSIALPGTASTFLRRALQPFRTSLTPLARRLGLGARMDDAARAVLSAQIEHFNPDIVLNQNIVLIDDAFVRSIRKAGRVIIAQHGVAPPARMDYSVYDFAITMLPYVAQHFRDAGLPAEQVHLAFETSILERLPPPPERDLAITFVGGIEAQYEDRIRILEAVAKRYPIELFISGGAALPASSLIERQRRNEVWGRDMYRVLQRSKITLNSHIDAAREFAGNMRLFEATGVGTCLLTDAKTNLSTLYDPRAEVATYASVDECLAQIERLLEDDSRRDKIAASGQARTLSAHTYLQRVEQILGYIARYGR